MKEGIKLDEIIRAIIDVDRKADEIEQMADKKVQDYRKDRDASIKAMENDMILDADKEAERLYQSAIGEASKEVQRINDEADKRCKELENRFQQKRQDITKRAFSIIINGEDGE